MKIDKKIIKELTDCLDEFNLTELEYTEKDTKIKVSKNNVTVNNQNLSNSNNSSIPNETKDKKKICIRNRNYLTNNWYCLSCTRTRCKKIC